MNLFKQLTPKKADNSGMNAALTFLISGVISGVGTYLFLTEKGVSARKMIVEKAGQLSDNISVRVSSEREKMAVVEPETVSSQSAGNDSIEEAAASVSKAQNMVGHLKHNKNSPSEPS